VSANAYRATREKVAAITAYLQESLSGIRVARSFAQEQRHPVKVREMRCNVKRSATRRLRRIVSLSRTRYLNRYAHSVWTVLERV
jgi:ABC-type multidrug transport system fused ATPase/permease subunit